MKLSELLKQTCKDRGVSLSELARMTNQTPQNLSMRCKRDSITFQEFMNYMELLDVDVHFSLEYPDGKTKTPVLQSDRLQKRMSILEENLEIEKKKTDFQRAISADMRTALFNVEGYVDLALEHKDEPKYLESTFRKLKVANRELKSLLDSSLYVANTIETKPVDEASAQGSMEGLRVLLAEDNEMNRDIAKEVLSSRGLIVDTVTDGEEAVKMIMKAAPGLYACVLMDVRMPNMDGLEATRKIRGLENRVRAAVPIIALTAAAFEEDRKSAIDAGMDAYLTKPIEPDQLFGTLAKYL